MRMRNLAAMLLLALPGAAAAQQAPATRSPLEVMKASLDTVRNAAEKERWNANIQLWTIALAHPGPIAKKDLTRMSTQFDRMTSNVSKIRVAAEKERWDANVEMWRVLIENKGVLTARAVSTLTPVFETMKANVAEIPRQRRVRPLDGEPRSLAVGDVPGGGRVLTVRSTHVALPRILPGAALVRHLECRCLPPPPPPPLQAPVRPPNSWRSRTR